jgi:hypothetical protein
VSILTTAYQRAAFGDGAFVRVVNWHNTPAAQRATLRAELAWYVERYQPVSPDDLDRLFDTGRWGLTKPGFIPAFYDGYLNNATVAAPVCAELGISAWFFPVTGFVSTEPDQQLGYADTHDVDLVMEERHQPRLAMSWDELAVLSRHHVIAAHTASHAQAGSIRTTGDAKREVLEPVRQITELTGRRPPAFAWLFGAAFDPESPAGAALLEAGIRYLASNTAYQRIAD